MSDPNGGNQINYGDTFHLKVWGVGIGPTSGARGYLALDASGGTTTQSGPALTTADPEAFWKFESPTGKTGVVEVQDIVNIVYVGPNTAYRSFYLQGGADANTPSIHAIPGDGKTDKSLQWEIPIQSNVVLAGHQSGIVTDDQYIMLSCHSNRVVIAGGNATGAFLVDAGAAAGNRVGTRITGNAGVGGDTWWMPCAAPAPAQSPTPAPSPAPTPSPAPAPSPGPSPSPSSSPNPLCGDLPTIMQSICSLIVLMNKVVDACYPQSSWPTTSYPTGCNDCGCKDKDKGTDC
jgi:hypothetical protein